jgi:Rieske Fe-S protein
MSQPASAGSLNSDSPAAIERRGVIAKLLAAGVGAVVAIVPLVPGAAFVLDPILRKKRTGKEAAGDGFLKITTLAALPADGTPQSFPVVKDLQDAWNKFPKTEVGSVYLSLNPDGTVTCFNACCPHLGCTVNYVPAAKNFLCPCHASSFSLKGERSNAIPPRPMDSLTAEIRNGDEVWVKFQNYKSGTAQQIPIS